MDAALGAPEKMAERADELTPMMSQYFELCREHDDSLVLFQVGDFYEAFCEAAERVARLCEITLTEREDSTGRYAMAGIPIDNAESYVETLLDAGYRVAIADQVEDPDEVSGVVERAVTRVLTPGTLTEDELLSSPDNNFVAALAAGDRRYGLALLDVSTGDFYATGAGEVGAIADEASRFAPAEAVVGPDVALDPERVFGPDCMVTPHEPDAFGYERAAEAVRAYFGDPERHLAARPEVRACGALLSYAEYTRGGAGGTSDEIAGEDVVDAGEPDGSEEVDGEGRSANADGDDGSANADGDGGPDAAAPVGRRDRLAYLDHLTRYDPREYMLLDAVALDGLEVFERRAVRGHEGRTLVDTVDETACALGRRRLGDWLRRPLLSGRRIERRHAAVDELVVDVGTRERLHELLADVYDLERLISRVARGRANARDLRSLAATLAVVPDVRETLAGAESALLAQLHDELDPVADVREEITAAIREDPPQEVTEGGVIREGYDADLDALRETERSGEEWIDRLEAGERERTGIDSLKVGHTAVHGYYIEVTDANLDRVPDDYRRRQTLKNSERYVTPELKEREDEIVRAGERADDLEYQLFRGVRATAAGEAARIQGLADRLATLDALVSFATVAARHDYCRPTVGGDRLAIEAGRHPVVERTEDRFVPNDVDLDAETSLTVLTGPNMSGKSTYMRQVALCCVLAQAGGFVPAAAAELPVIDRLYTRVGASDDIAGGRSTFMIEMTELADILAGATEDSLVLLDEVGRGTSTADGLAIARAVTEHVHDEVGAYTLFATHHHDLTDLAERLPGARNRHFETRREDGDVAFEHRLAPGPAAASYGVEVADMAGVPDPVVDRARGLLSRGDDPDGAERDGDRPEPRAAADTDGFAATDGSDPDGHRSNGTGEDRSAGGDGDADPDSDPGPDPVRERLRELDVATMTPIEAMNALADLQNDVE